jgi:hypothetical protein
MDAPNTQSGNQNPGSVAYRHGSPSESAETRRYGRRNFLQSHHRHIRRFDPYRVILQNRRCHYVLDRLARHISCRDLHIRDLPQRFFGLNREYFVFQRKVRTERVDNETLLAGSPTRNHAALCC